MTNHIATSFTISKKTLETVPMPTIIEAIIGIKSTINNEYMSDEAYLPGDVDSGGITLKFFTGLPDKDNNAIHKALATGADPYDVIQGVLDQYKNTEDIKPWYGAPDDEVHVDNENVEVDRCLRRCESQFMYAMPNVGGYGTNDTDELIEDFKYRSMHSDSDPLIVALRETEQQATPSPARCIELQQLLADIEESMQYCVNVHSVMLSGLLRMYRVPHIFPDAFRKAEIARARDLKDNPYVFNLYYNLMQAHNKISIILARAGVKDMVILDYDPE